MNAVTRFKVDYCGEILRFTRQNLAYVLLCLNLVIFCSDINGRLSVNRSNTEIFNPDSDICLAEKLLDLNSINIKIISELCRGL